MNQAELVTIISKIYWTLATDSSIIQTGHKSCQTYLSQQTICIHHLFREQAHGGLYFIKRMTDVLQGC